MILIVNLNLAIDEIVHLDGFAVGAVHRTHHVERLAGGKGVNVARVLKALNERALLAGFLGGRAGEFIKRELQREELQSSCVPIQNESRICIILNDGASRTQTVINEAGPEVTEEEMRSFYDHYAQLLSSSDLVIITGSLPPKLSTDVYARLISTANEAGRPVLLDTSGEALRQSISAQPFIVKINRTEAVELSGIQINDFDDAIRAARKLIDMGACRAMITLGAMGAALNFEGVVYKIKSPRIEARNSVGSGDAVMAGLAAALGRGLDVEGLARLAVSAGAANALRGAGRCKAEEIYRLMQDVDIF